MTKAQIKIVLTNLTKLILPIVEVFGFTINKKLEYTFTNGNLDFSLNGVGNYGDFITIEPYFVLHHEEAENYISNFFSSIRNTGLFKINHRLGSFIGVKDFNSNEFNNFDFENFVYKYKIYNSNDVVKCSVDIMKYLQTVGI